MGLGGLWELVMGGLACCSSWGLKESDTTERMNWLNWMTETENNKLQRICFVKFYSVEKKRKSLSFWNRGSPSENVMCQKWDGAGSMLSFNLTYCWLERDLQKRRGLITPCIPAEWVPCALLGMQQSPDLNISLLWLGRGSSWQRINR